MHIHHGMRTQVSAIRYVVFFVIYFQNQCRLHISVINFLAYICCGSTRVYKLGYWEPQSGNSKKKMFIHVCRRYMVLQINAHTLTNLKIFTRQMQITYNMFTIRKQTIEFVTLYTCTVKVKTI